MSPEEAISIFDKSAERTRPNQQTAAWEVLRAHIADLTAALKSSENEWLTLKDQYSELAWAIGAEGDAWFGDPLESHDDVLGRASGLKAANILLEASEREAASAWRTDWPDMKPRNESAPSIWQSERVIVTLTDGTVTYDRAESFEGKRPIWFINRDAVRAWRPFPAPFIDAAMRSQGVGG